MSEAGVMIGYVTLRAPHRPEAWKLDDIKAEMRRMGAPTIHAVWRADHWQALEGSHRIAAARELNLVPSIVRLTTRDTFDHDLLELLEPPHRDFRVSSILRVIDSWRERDVSYSFIGMPTGRELPARHAHSNTDPRRLSKRAGRHPRLSLDVG